MRKELLKLETSERLPKLADADPYLPGSQPVGVLRFNIITLVDQKRINIYQVPSL